MSAFHAAQGTETGWWALSPLEVGHAGSNALAKARLATPLRVQASGDIKDQVSIAFLTPLDS